MAKKKKTADILINRIDKSAMASDLYVIAEDPHKDALNEALQAYIRENKLAAYNVMHNIAEVSDGFIVASYKD